MMVSANAQFPAPGAMWSIHSRSIFIASSSTTFRANGGICSVPVSVTRWYNADLEMSPGQTTRISGMSIGLANRPSIKPCSASGVSKRASK